VVLLWTGLANAVDKKTAVQPLSEELLLKEAEALNVSEEEWANKLKEQNRSFLKIAGEVFVLTSSQAVQQWLEIIQKEKYLIARIEAFHVTQKTEENYVLVFEESNSIDFMDCIVENEPQQNLVDDLCKEVQSHMKSIITNYVHLLLLHNSK